MNPKILLITAACLWALGAHAQAPGIWRWVDSAGYTHYTQWPDVPPRHRERAVPADAPLPADMPACEVAWHRYAASQACFDAFRVVGGGLKPEAFRYCTELPEPQPCR